MTQVFAVEDVEVLLLKSLPSLNELTAEEAARTLYEFLREFVGKIGYDPDAEVYLRSPEDSDNNTIAPGCWWVCWESGPYSWGVGYSLSGKTIGTKWYGDTHYGFDIIFEEDA